MTNADRLSEALKILGVSTEPTEKEGRLAWYAASGEYLGTYGVEDGLEYLQKLIKNNHRGG